MLDDLTLREVFHFRVSLLGAISFITVSIVALILLLSALIIYTPLRNILPGYSASLRQQLIDESARVDSLQADLTIQRRYLDVIKQMAAGDIKTDSVQSLDSMQVVERSRILEQHNENTDAFLAQYELKEHERLLLFDNIAERDVRQLHRPVRGVVVQEADPVAHRFTTAVHTAKNENVLAVMRGTVVAVVRMADNTYSLTMQNGAFVAVYSNIARVLKTESTQVEKGETIGLMDGEHDLELCLWDAGRFVNPGEVIVW